MHSDHTEPDLMPNAHHHLEVWRRGRDGAGAGHNMMISYHGPVISVRRYKAEQATVNQPV